MSTAPQVFAAARNRDAGYCAGCDQAVPPGHGLAYDHAGRVVTCCSSPRCQRRLGLTAAQDDGISPPASGELVPRTNSPVDGATKPQAVSPELTLSILIPAAVLDRVSKTLGRLAQRAGVAWQIVPGVTTLIIPDPHREGKTVAVECSRVSVSELPRENGWAFVARLQHTEAGVVVSTLPGEALHHEWREADPRCQHCNTQRQRHDTFVLRGPKGQLRQVGRNCLADFCSANAAAMVARAEWCEQMSDWFPESDPDEGRDPWGSYHGHTTPSTVEYLAAVCKSTRVDGFRRSNEECSTKDAGWFAVGKPPRESKAYKIWQDAQPEEADLAEAHEIMIWAATDDEFARSDYGHNVRVALACRGIDQQRAGLVASAPAAYHRAISKTTARPARPADGGHWGAIKERATVQATFTGISFVDSDWGGKAVVRFRTAAGGQDLVWFATGAHPPTDDVGGEFLVTATVKKHEQYKGRAQTVVTRAKVAKVSA